MGSPAKYCVGVLIHKGDSFFSGWNPVICLEKYLSLGEDEVARKATHWDRDFAQMKSAKEVLSLFPKSTDFS